MYETQTWIFLPKNYNLKMASCPNQSCTQALQSYSRLRVIQTQFQHPPGPSQMVSIFVISSSVLCVGLDPWDAPNQVLIVLAMLTAIAAQRLSCRLWTFNLQFSSFLAALSCQIAVQRGISGLANRSITVYKYGLSDGKINTLFWEAHLSRFSSG